MEEKRKDTRLKIRIDSAELDDAIRKARQLKDLLSEIKCLSEGTAEKIRNP